MTYSQAKTLKKGDAIIYAPHYGGGMAEEVKFVSLDYDKNGDVIIVCTDWHEVHRWGHLLQFTLIQTEF